MKDKKIEKNIKTNNSEEKLLAIFNSVRDGLVILDKTGKILQVSESLVKMGGYSEKEIIGKRLKLMTMFTPKSLIQILANFVRTIAGQDILPYEVEATTKDGRKIFGEISGTPLRRGGKIVGVVAIIREITERKRIEEEIIKKSEELEKFNKLAVGRELQMVELKKKIKELEEKLKQKEIN